MGEPGHADQTETEGPDVEDRAKLGVEGERGNRIGSAQSDEGAEDTDVRPSGRAREPAQAKHGEQG